MQPPKINNSTKEERQAYVLEAWKCLHDKGDDMDESEEYRQSIIMLSPSNSPRQSMQILL